MIKYLCFQRLVHIVTYFFVIQILLISSCSPIQINSSINVTPFVESKETYPQAEIIFQVRLTTSIPENDELFIEILDEVTGSFFNPTRYEMIKQDDLTYFARIPLTIGIRIKYRFVRQSLASLYEYNSQNKQIDYRVAYIEGPLLIQDLIAAWEDLLYSGPVGCIRGQLFDESNQLPIPNTAIYVAGTKTISASDGTFIIEGLPVWTHNVVIDSLDGSYRTFQQTAVVADSATTPIYLGLQKRKLVKVNFEVRMPDGFKTNLPLRLASNYFPFGYSGSELRLGSSLISSNLPALSQDSNNIYTFSADLPSGVDLKYKFTLGDGFWNAELLENGTFITRVLIVPDENVMIRKKIESFQSPSKNPITLTVNVPENTPENESVSLQLNAFGWMEPLIMEKIGEKQWNYTLYSPTHLVGNIEYRFCRNDQCDSSVVNEPQGAIITPEITSQTITVELESWRNLVINPDAVSIETGGIPVFPRTDFITGFELIKNLSRTWNNSIDTGIDYIQLTGANWLIYSPTWSVSSINPPLFSPVSEFDYLWPDLITIGNKISANGLQPVIFPQISSSSEMSNFWAKAKKDEAWWQLFFERYQRFMLQNADLANQISASAIIVGDPDMNPSMQDRIIADDELTLIPQNADALWKQLIIDIRSRYSGPVVGVLSLPNSNEIIPEWLSSVDAIYVLFSPKLDYQQNQTEEERIQIFTDQLISLVKPISERFNKPVLIGLNYNSSSSAADGCIDVNGSCKENSNGDYDNHNLDLVIQSKLYNIAFISCANQNWVSGFISRNFNPLIMITDKSPSVYGKPASDVIWFWYHFIQNKTS